MCQSFPLSSSFNTYNNTIKQRFVIISLLFYKWGNSFRKVKQFLQRLKMRGRAKSWKSSLVPQIYVFTLFQVTSSQIVCAEDKGLRADAKGDLYTSLEHSDGLICPDPGRPSWQDASTYPSMMTTEEQRRNQERE